MGLPLGDSACVLPKGGFWVVVALSSAHVSGKYE